MGLDGLLAMLGDGERGMAAAGCFVAILLLIGFFVGCISSGGESTVKKDDPDDDDRTMFD
jgi:hypothetical protein